MIIDSTFGYYDSSLLSPSCSQIPVIYSDNPEYFDIKAVDIPYLPEYYYSIELPYYEEVVDNNTNFPWWVFGILGTTSDYLSCCQLYNLFNLLLYLQKESSFL